MVEWVFSFEDPASKGFGSMVTVTPDNSRGYRSKDHVFGLDVTKPGVAMEDMSDADHKVFHSCSTEVRGKFHEFITSSHLKLPIRSRRTNILHTLPIQILIDLLGLLLFQKSYNVVQMKLTLTTLLFPYVTD